MPYIANPIILSFTMKKLLLWGSILALGATSCRSQCPAYSLTKPATQVASPILAQAADNPVRQ
ncbi:hypothetical protein Hsw_3012 [Hymenobacter swuensis DY53]|uniref:Uncharacterized protein n=1 Tax=Hymenobacter swuensis DY53 TaxID=1227739 RepID=W8F3K8_9BACT|nr:hypothetical protein Hsw_3012 [Hymenobacter swuensis DY53]